MQEELIALSRRYPQLLLPIRAGMRETEEYKNAVLCGLPLEAEPDFRCPEEIELSAAETPAGRAEILYLGDRADFLHAYQALAYRCEPTPIPDSVGAVTLNGLINWEKINRHHDDYIAAGGELENTGANCDHHHHGEDHSCAEHGCGGHGCHGGCHATPLFEGKNVGKTCRVHYRGTFNDGTEFDSSYDRNEPLEFICGVGQMIEGFDRAVADMEVGQEVDIHLAPSEAYGEADPDAILTVKLERLHGAENLTVGQRIHLRNQYGQPFPAQVVAIDDQSITFDANHPMAGKELNFHIELVSCE